MKTYVLDREPRLLDESFYAAAGQTGLELQALPFPADHEEIARIFEEKSPGLVFLPAIWDDLFSVKIVEEIQNLGTPMETVIVGASVATSNLVTAFNNGLTSFLETPVVKEYLSLSVSRASAKLNKKLDIHDMARRLELYEAGSTVKSFNPTTQRRDHLLGQAYLHLLQHQGPLANGDVHILLVSTSPSQQKQLAVLLRKLGAQVTEAASMKDGCDQLEKQPYPVIISDNVLPDGDAATFARNTRTIVKENVPYFIVWSSSPEKATEMLNPETKINDIILKPGPDMGLESILPAIIAGVYQSC